MEIKKEHTEKVNHPHHYNTGKVEVIDIIEQGVNGHLGIVAFDLGNVLKYILRAGKKNKDSTLQDLKKAQWYLLHCIEKIEKEEV